MAKSYTLTLAGDTSLGDYYFHRSNEKNLLDRLDQDPLSFFRGVSPLIEGSHHLIINLETVLAHNPSNSLKGKKYPTWDHPERTLRILKELGVTAASLANNHVMDFGSSIFLETKAKLESSGIVAFGGGANEREASKPLEIELQGEKSQKKIYLFSSMRASKRYRRYGYFATKEDPGAYLFSLKRLKESAERIKEKDREATIILFPHWQGFDYRWVSPRIEEICKELVQSGIDYVIGQGPHMVNHMATVDNGLILYSIGNFVYNSPGRYAKMDAPPYSCIVRLEIEEEGEGWIFRTKLYPILSDNKRTGYQVRPIDQKEAEELLLILNQKSPSLALRLDRDDRGLFFGLQGGKPLMKESSKVSIFLTKIPIKKKNSYQGVFSTRRLMEEAFCKFGYRTEMKGEYLQVHIGHKKVLFFESQSSFVSHLSWKILKDKGLAREFFQEAGLAIAKGEIFAKAEKEKAALFAKSLPSYVVKPSDGRKGMGVTVGVTQEKDFSTSWDLAAKKSKKGILIEEYFKEGIEARYLSVWGKCVAVYEKIPPMVIGNGADTVEDLLKEKNRDRSNNPHLKKSLIQLNPNRIAIIEEQGFTLSSIPEKGQEVFIDWKGSISAGGDTQDCTEDAHPFFKQIAERAATAVPGLDIVGVDILAHDHRIEPTAKNYIIVEANTRPGLGGHLFPMHGEPRNVAGIIAEETIKSIDSLESSL